MAETVTDAPAAVASDPKEGIYIMIADFVKERTSKNIGKTGGHVLFDQITAEVFRIAVQEGYFRFNRGYGSLEVKHYGAGTRRLPSGQEVVFGERSKLRYNQGKMVKELIKPGSGDEDESPPDTAEDEDLD